MGSPLCAPLARLCLQCNWNIHSDQTVKNHDDSRILLCNNYVSQTAAVQCIDKGLCLCQTCVLNPNICSRFFLLQNDSSYNSAYDCLDSDSSSSSWSSSFVDRNWPFSYGSLPLINEDSSSSFEIFNVDDNYTKNSYSDQQVLPMLQPDNLDIPKDSSYSGFNGCEIKEDVENVLLKTFDCGEAVLDLQEYNPADEGLILTDQLIDELTKHNAETTSTKIISSSSPSGMSHKDYNVEALANAKSQDYYGNQMIGSEAKEETNNIAIFPNALVQLDCGPSELILTGKMLPWENQTYESVPRCTPEGLEEAKKRYFAKKKKRKFVKQIRYESRKSTADTKRRMKGRFTKAGAEYDYDPQANNTKKGTNKIMS